MPGPTPTEPPTDATVPGGMLAPWKVGKLPAPPAPGWRLWLALLGPGVVLAGTSIGSGEWLFGPAVSAQYGAALLWLATLSIVFQVFCNLTMMRYAIYCGEPIIVGGLRTRPGPAFWIAVYLVLDLAAIWPFNASNAAVPLAAAILGHLPGEGQLRVAGLLMSEAQLVRSLGFAVFLLAFVPLFFGGTVYRILALGFSALHALYAVRTLMPKPLRPHWLMQIGVVLCGIFFIGISLVVMVDLWNTLDF